jgi:hypothetical protein
MLVRRPSTTLALAIAALVAACSPGATNPHAKATREVTAPVTPTLASSDPHAELFSPPPPPPPDYVGAWRTIFEEVNTLDARRFEHHVRMTRASRHGRVLLVEYEIVVDWLAYPGTSELPIESDGTLFDEAEVLRRTRANPDLKTIIGEFVFPEHLAFRTRADAVAALANAAGVQNARRASLQVAGQLRDSTTNRPMFRGERDYVLFTSVVVSPPGKTEGVCRLVGVDLVSGAVGAVANECGGK